MFGGEIEDGSVADADRRLYGVAAGDLAGFSVAVVGASAATPRTCSWVRRGATRSPATTPAPRT
ncbi:hypothetical protein [Halobaculum litoreum]|uniref:hypothetical protein n=1 Tax=Halobaculum litoreum TaxID=3031998 RepID=UPI0024C391BB|nr:hypothetical protein [Halobaculum sp. DT92]